MAPDCMKYIQKKEQELLDALRMLFMNRYFRRIWTVQEIAMAHQVKVYYGANSFTWPDFVTCATSSVRPSVNLRNVPGDIVDILGSYSKLRQGLETHFAFPSLYTVVALRDKQHRGNIYQKLEKNGGIIALIQSKGLEATEPKDQAYAMLWAFRSSKSSDLGTPLFEVDYNKSLETIYTEYTAALIKNGFDMRYLLAMVNGRRRTPCLPSWVPDWNEETSSMFLMWIARLNKYKASKRNYPGPFERVGSNSLTTWGIEYSKIKAVIRQDHHDELDIEDSSLGLNPPDRRALQFSRLVRDEIEAGRMIPHVDDERLMRGLCTAILGNDAKGPDGVITANIDVIGLRIFSLLISVIDHPLDSPETQRVREGLGEFLPKETIDAAFHEAEQDRGYPLVLVFLHGVLRNESWIHECILRWPLHHLDKDFFITESGYLGMAYRGVEEGDLVTIWSGSPCPTVARKKEVDGMQAYHFHGVAYVDRIMNGEAWPETEEELQEFILV